MPLSDFTSPLLPRVSGAEISTLLEMSRTNSPPNDTTSLMSLLSACGPEISRYNEELAQVTLTLARLVHERDTLRRYVDTATSILAPINRLPAELLLKILSLHIEAEPGHRSGYDQQSDQQYYIDVMAQRGWTLLSMVCYRWYQLILGTPTIWAHIDAGFETLDDEELDLVPRLLDTVLNRSQRTPLDIVYQEGTDLRRNVINSFMETSPRWRSAFLVMDSKDPWEFGHIRELPLLEELRLQKPNCFDALPATPRLTKLRMYLGDTTPLLDYLIPWAQLKVVHLESGYQKDRPSARRTSQQLSFMSKLDLQCFVDLDRLDTPQYESSTPGADTDFVVVSGIQGLLLREADEASVGRFLPLLELPNLRDLHLRGCAYNHWRKRRRMVPWPEREFASFAHRSPHLTNLCLEDISLSAAELLAVLALTPELEVLYFEDLKFQIDLGYNFLFGDEVLQGLLAADEDRRTPLVPKLRDLSVSSYFQCHESLLFDLLDSRGRRDRPFVFRAVVLIQTEDLEVYWREGNEKTETLRDRLRASTSVKQGRVRFTVDVSRKIFCRQNRIGDWN
ncbi:F-box domain-containing protein [Mycena kentingensis (nom. inval.)]|nr:F-box domain-containing protein [Mycena kentingensis (nom. inval.)]